MDWPKSTPGVGLVDGQFVDEDKTTGRPGSLIPAGWGNAVTAEILGVIAEAGEAPDESNPAQLRAAVVAIAERVSPVATKAEAEDKDEATSDNVKRMTPLRVLQAIKTHLINAGEAVVGMLRVGTQAEVNAGVLDDVVVTPLKLEASRPKKALARAWVNFNGQGVVSIRASFNVSSITDNGTGDYTVNLSTPMPNAAYATVTSGSGTDAGITGINCTRAYARTTTSFKVGTTQQASGQNDFVFVEALVFSS